MARKAIRKPVGEAVDAWMHLPPGTLGKNCRMEIMGNRELCVEGCQGVLEYEESLIRLNLGQRQLQITGTGLSIRTLEKNYGEVEGLITAIEFV